MVLRKLFFLGFSALLLAYSFIQGCKDLGSEIPLPPPPAPSVTAIIPAADTVGAVVKITGSNFGSAHGSSFVLFGAVTATVYPQWLDGEILVIVPNGAVTASVKVVVGGQESNSVAFEVLLPVENFGVSQKNVTLSVGDSIVQTISGGTLPYRIVENSDTTRVFAAINGNTLKIRGRVSGTSKVIIGDNSIPQLRDTINVTTVTPLAIGQRNISLSVSDSLVQTISGGTPPYSVVSQGNTSVTTASVTGNSLTIRAVGVGSSVVVIGDNSVPQLRDSVTVTVTANVVSFASKIKLIFSTYGCTGCHPSNGGLNLSPSQSYSNLVNVQAQAGCTDKKRVLPGNANESVLYIRVSASTSNTICGSNSRMPKGGSRINQSDIDLIRDWINQGAQNN